MNTLKNNVQLIGNLGADPEIKTFDKGKMARLSIATNNVYKNKAGEKVTDTQWHTVVAWDNLADLAESYLKKGNEIAVTGRLVNRSWEDKTGEKKYITEVVLNELMMLRSK